MARRPYAAAADAQTVSALWHDVRDSRIVVVDDNQANVLVLRRLLQQAGFTHITAWTAPQDALVACLADPPDLVLVDLVMPALDGVAFLSELRHRLPADAFVPVVVLTANPARTGRDGALAAGATDFLTKPLDHTEVLLRVRNLLHTRALYAKLQRDKQLLQDALDEREAWQRQRSIERQQKIDRLERLLCSSALSTVWQPIKDLRTMETIGVEALTRIPLEPACSPHVLFNEATEVGMGLQFELAAVSAALASMRVLPAGHFLSVNASPQTAQSTELSDLLAGDVEGRVVIELTEHEAVEGYDRLKRALDELRDRGARVAIDDAGAGYASLQHILTLRPDIIKLDSSLTCAINADPARRALAAALVSFGREIGAEIVAEGIETEQELEVLQALGVPWGQGYYLGRPTPPPWPLTDHSAR